MIVSFLQTKLQVLLHVKLFQGCTEDDIIDRVLHDGGANVEFISEVQTEEDTSSPGI